MSAYPRRVVVDANLLIPKAPRDYLIYASDTEVIQIHWSEKILNEGMRNFQRHREKLWTQRVERDPEKYAHIAAGVQSREDREGLEKALRSYARVKGVEVPMDVRFESIERSIPGGQRTVDAKDRHVLAAAVKVGGGVIVTNNTGDFPDQDGWGSDRGVEAMSLGRLIRLLVEENPGGMTRTHARVIKMSTNKNEVSPLVALDQDGQNSAAADSLGQLLGLRTVLDQGRAHRRQRLTERQASHKGPSAVSAERSSPATEVTESSTGSVWVEAHERKSGTHVPGHWRSRPQRK